MSTVANGTPATVTETKKKVKSIVLTSTGSGSDYSNLQIKDEDFPKIEKDDQVIVKIKASGLNFAELMQRQGLYRPSTKTPYTPGYEGAGIVEEVGAGVTEFAKGDRVIVFNSNSMWKEYVILPKTHMIKIPDRMPFEDAAALIVNYVTAYQILFHLANIKPGESVLIHMAGGGVGIAATQLCRTVPNVKIFGTSSVSKHEALKENGVDYPIDYHKENYVEEIRKICPEGIDVVLDPLNGEHSIKGYDLLKPFGRIVHFGAASMTQESRSLISAFKTWWKCLSINSLDIVSENKSVSGYHLGYLTDKPAAMKKTWEDIQTLLNFYQDGKIKIKVDKIYPYSKIGEAMKRLHERKNVGKVLLKPDSEMPTEAISTETTTKTPVASPTVVAETTTKKSEAGLVSTDDILIKEKQAEKKEDDQQPPKSEE